MEQLFGAVLKQKETSGADEAFWTRRLTLLRENCGFTDEAHLNYINKRLNQLQVRPPDLCLFHEHCQFRRVPLVSPKSSFGDSERKICTLFVRYVVH